MKNLLKLSLAGIARETGAEFAGSDALIEYVSTDTRDLPQGCLFVALTGDIFDGHDFISEALQKGAGYAVSMKEGDWPKEKTLFVKDTRDVLLAIARLHRRTLQAKIVAVTGSVGKTTTKEMIACVLESAFETVKTEKNLNNEIGLSKTVLSLGDTTRAAVLEMGTDGPGQIRRLSLAALPDIGVITGIGVSHIEAFKTREGILSEKIDITAGMKPGSDIILCGDNDLLKTVIRPEFNVLYYGIENRDSFARAENICEHPGHTDFEVICGEDRLQARIPCIGRHNVLNALAAFCVGLRFGIEPAACAGALKNYRPAGMRQRIVAHNSYTVVEDCYNASPDSMRAALETLGGFECGGRRIAALSDMLELGDNAPEYHAEVGRFASKCGIDILACTGPLSRGYREGAVSGGLEAAYHFESQEDLFKYLKDILKPGDVVWFKASRGMKLEQVMERLYSL